MVEFDFSAISWYNLAEFDGATGSCIFPSPVPEMIYLNRHSDASS